jgi:hypothetical protein
MSQEITKTDLIDFQNKWGESVVEVGRLFSNNGNFQQAAKKLVETFYGYKEGPVLFKPTRAQDQQFRLDESGALSYFIGNNSNFAEDTGFALQPWTKVRFENHGFVFNPNQATAMGNYFFTDLNGNDKKVEYTFGIFRNKEGQLKINLHHSSVPYLHPKHT